MGEAASAGGVEASREVKRLGKTYIRGQEQYSESFMETEAVQSERVEGNSFRTSTQVYKKC